MKFDLVILNFVNYWDTIELLDSLNDSDLSSVSSVRVVDNASGNDSLNKIIHSVSDSVHFEKIKFIQSEKNEGYGPGNNIGLEGFLSDGKADAVVVCNNDIVFPEQALTAMLKRVELMLVGNIGVVGSALTYYDRSDVIQSAGCGFSAATCKTRNVGNGDCFSSAHDYQVSAPVGALMVFSREVLLDVGLFSTDYFLYYEELDYVFRMQRCGWDFRMINDVNIYHKEGGSVGSSSKGMRSVSNISDYYIVVNKIRFIMKNKPFFIANAFAVVVYHIVRRLIFSEWRKALNIVRFFFFLPPRF